MRGDNQAIGIGTNLKPPCKPDCPNRSATCHRKGNCEAYDKYAEENARIRERKAEDRKAAAHVNHAIDDLVKRVSKRRKGHR